MKLSLSFVCSLLALSGALALFGFLFLKTGEAISATVADRAASAAAGQEESAQKTLQAFVADTAADQSELASYVADDTSVVGIIQTIEDAASREGVSVTIGAISVVPADWRYHETLSLSLSATGSFSALAAFSTDLESLPYASHPASVSFQTSSGKNWFASYTLDFLKQKGKSS
jgi:hypothetical protein